MINLKNTKLKNMFKLSSKVTVYVPATVDVNKAIDNTKQVEEVAATLSNLFGGATSTAALGYWISQGQGMVKEKTTLVFAYCEDVKLKTGIKELIDLCEKLKTEMKQEAIAIEINGELYFI